jgi:hypothetical protein
MYIKKEGDVKSKNWKLYIVDHLRVVVGKTWKEIR